MNKSIQLLIVVTILLIINSCSESVTEPQIFSYDWETASPESQGFDSNKLESAATEAESRGSIYSMVVVRNDFLIYENYFQGKDRNTPHIVRSVSKSYLSVLIGIALEQGHIKSIDEKLIDYFPEYFENEKDYRKGNITIRHLLTHTSGFGDDQANYNTFFSSSNWIKTICESSLSFNPGAQFQYSTGGTHLLSGILTKAIGMSAKEFAEKNLLNKIGVTIGEWQQDPQGNYFGGNNMYFTTRDMARFGQLLLNKGNLNGEQIIPLDWAENSVRNLRGRTGSTPWGDLSQIGYGYLWWTGKINSYSVYMALGHGGQFIVNIPILSMTVVITSNGFVDWDNADLNEKSALDIIANYILPAISNPS